MSYIIKSATPFTSVKLTETGREKLAKGQLDFNTWAIGDSEINYTREAFVQDGTLTGDTSIVLRPQDQQPNIKYFINRGGAQNTFSFGTSDIRCIKLTVNNEADERGFFEGELATGFTTNVDLTGYTRTSSTAVTIGGGTTFTLAGVEIGDFILIKGNYTDLTNNTPEPHLWFKAQNVVGTTVTVDRELPNFGAGNTVVVYKGGNVYDNEPDAIAYWDTGTLSFDSSCDITVTDVPIWNMNIPFSEDILGVDDPSYETHIKYGSYNYLGQKNNYLYSPSTNLNLKSSAILHYSNKTISNLYGEFFYIDNDTKSVKVHLPDLMYHRRTFSGGTSGGDQMGMTFVASGTSTSTGINGLTYIPLIEEPTLVNGTPRQVGRVFQQLKIIVIDDAEIVAAMSYKSNRNWTLPTLNLSNVNPSGGPSTGILPVGQTIYVTYALNNTSGTGISESLPCQNYVSYTNTNSNTRDIQFNIENTGILPYLQNDASSGGFYANEYKVLYQITDGSRPTSDGWLEVDFTSNVATGGFVQGTALEIQNPNAPVYGTGSLELNATTTSGAPTFSLITDLGMPSTTTPDILNFGDERFFYGNVEAFIGATIFKTIFKITINASDFAFTTNVSRSNDPATNPANIKVSEVGIYDSAGDLVIMGKLSQPVELAAGKTVVLELGIDF